MTDALTQAQTQAQVQTQSLMQVLKRALNALPESAPVAIALSGGADSAAMAIAAARVCQATARPLHFFHIHHGLFVQADAWVEQVRALANLLNTALFVEYVAVAQDSGLGIEGAAREARYAALVAMAGKQQSHALLLAHHRQDQAETVLLRLLRGAGVQGLAAMQANTERQGLRMLRPFLDIDRADLLACVAEFTQQTGWLPIQDPSNIDPKYARGAFRSSLLPVLQAHWPAWQQTLTRHARQAAETVEILDEVAANDLAGLNQDPLDKSFSLKLWRELSHARQALVLRYWLQQQGIAMPGDRRLADLLRQLRQLHALGHDRDLLWQHGQIELRCRQGRVLLAAPQ